MIQNFYCSDGGFYNSSNQDLPIRIIDATDGAMPSGNSIAITLLFKLYLITQNEKYLKLGEISLKKFWKNLSSYPLDYSYLISSIGYLVNPLQLLVVYLKEEDIKEVLKSLVYNPYKVNIFVKDGASYPLLENFIRDKRALEGKVTYYLCRSFTCNLPTNDLSKILEELSRSFS
ncbi:hypothetical protein HRbin06_00972 [archaeon HR06]|nr:hypothetical protein HRbin06_00972 [archaeon HR06]